MTGTIGYLDAWSMWLSGQEVDPQLRMGPMTVLWWGRVGKIAAFMGGLTIILDLVGTERLREAGRRLNASIYGFGAFFWIVQILIWLMLAAVGWDLIINGTGPSSITVMSVVSLVLCGLLLLVLFGVRWLLWGLDHRVPGWGIRLTAAILIAVGFHFDLLAS